MDNLIIRGYHKRIEQMCGTLGTEWIDFIVFDGTHEFYKNDEPIKRLVDELYKEG